MYDSRLQSWQIAIELKYYWNFISSASNFR